MGPHGVTLVEHLPVNPHGLPMLAQQATLLGIARQALAFTVADVARASGTEGFPREPGLKEPIGPYRSPIGARPNIIKHFIFWGSFLEI